MRDSTDCRSGTRRALAALGNSQANVRCASCSSPSFRPRATRWRRRPRRRGAVATSRTAAPGLYRGAARPLDTLRLHRAGHRAACLPRRRSGHALGVLTGTIDTRADPPRAADRSPRGPTCRDTVRIARRRLSRSSGRDARPRQRQQRAPVACAGDSPLRSPSTRRTPVRPEPVARGRIDRSAVAIDADRTPRPAPAGRARRRSVQAVIASCSRAHLPYSA